MTVCDLSPHLDSSESRKTLEQQQQKNLQMDTPNPTVLRNTFDSTNSFFFLRVTMFLPTVNKQ